MTDSTRPKVSIHKFSSCDGCQLAFLNLGNDLITLTNLIDVKHFAEAGFVDDNLPEVGGVVDIAFIEGSISTGAELERIKKIRENSRLLITIGACATSGGIQALRNMFDANAWIEGIYAKPEYIDSLKTVSPIKDHVTVDFEVWGCPVSSDQIIEVIRSLLSGVMPIDSTEKVCAECKRSQTVCRMVVNGEACMGPVTKAGCGAICPTYGRACYACYGPSSDSNSTALNNRFQGLGLLPEEVARKYLLFNNNAPVFNSASRLAVSGTSTSDENND